MIPLKYEGYETFSFVELLRKIKDTDTIKDKEIQAAFKEMFFDPSSDYYRKLSFIENKYTFLTTPLRKSSNKGEDDYEKETYYFKQPSAQNYILAYFSITPSNIHAFFKNVENFCKANYKSGTKKILSYYSSERIEKIKSYNDKLSELYRVKLNDYWNVYLRYREAGHTYIALGMLLLVSVLNTTVISFLPSIKKT